MQKEVDMVAEFHRTYEHPISYMPTTDVSEALQRARARFINEELGELRDAMEQKNIVEVADALTDIMYFVIGTAHIYGLGDKLEACFAEVHASNMSKLGEDGKPIKREDGKIIKGPNYFKPNLVNILFPPIKGEELSLPKGKTSKCDCNACKAAIEVLVDHNNPLHNLDNLSEKEESDFVNPPVDGCDCGICRARRLRGLNTK